MRGAGYESSPAITTRVVTVKGEQSVSGALFGSRGADGSGGDGRITEINGFRIEAIPSGHMVITRNRDVPGVIGYVGTILGAHGVNVSRFHLGRHERGGEAMAVIQIDAPLADETLEELQAFEQIVSVRRIVLES
jgi:D-3-phosphoglycerate dehydrogenase